MNPFWEAFKILLQNGRVTELVFFLLAGIVTWYLLYKSTRGQNFELRILPQVQAISDGIDRAVEQGLQVICTPGNLAYLSGLYAPMTINGMNILRYVAKLCVRKGATLMCPVPTNPQAMPLIQNIYQEAAIREGKPEAYNPDNVKYFGGTEETFAIGVTGEVMSKGCALMIIVGATSSSEMMPAGAGLSMGTMIIAGTPRYVHQATWACMSDYPLFCDDIYAAGALCSEDNSVRASIVGGDVIKLGMMVTLIASLVLQLAGLHILDLLVK